MQGRNWPLNVSDIIFFCMSIYPGIYILFLVVPALQNVIQNIRWKFVPKHAMEENSKQRLRDYDRPIGNSDSVLQVLQLRNDLPRHFKKGIYFLY